MTARRAAPAGRDCQTYLGCTAAWGSHHWTQIWAGRMYQMQCMCSMYIGMLAAAATAEVAAKHSSMSGPMYGTATYSGILQTTHTGNSLLSLPHSTAVGKWRCFSKTTKAETKYMVHMLLEWLCVCSRATARGSMLLACLTSTQLVPLCKQQCILHFATVMLLLQL